MKEQDLQAVQGDRVFPHESGHNPKRGYKLASTGIYFISQDFGAHYEWSRLPTSSLTVGLELASVFITSRETFF